MLRSGEGNERARNNRNASVERWDPAAQEHGDHGDHPLDLGILSYLSRLSDPDSKLQPRPRDPDRNAPMGPRQLAGSFPRAPAAQGGEQHYRDLEPGHAGELSRRYPNCI